VDAVLDHRRLVPGEDLEVFVEFGTGYFDEAGAVRV